MWHEYGKAEVEARLEPRRLHSLKEYLRSEYGSTIGTGLYLAEADGPSSPRAGLRSFLRKIAAPLARPQVPAATPTITAECSEAEEAAPQTTVRAEVRLPPKVGQLHAGRRLRLRPNTELYPTRK